jgi:molybdenum cofactor synthesis domain-containing protein
MLEDAGVLVRLSRIVPDELDTIKSVLIEWSDEHVLDLIITTGGTGLFPRDVTPDATVAVIEREIPGIQEAVRAKGGAATPMAMLSRGVAGVRGKTLIINLPGNPAAVRDGLEVVLPVLAHAIEKINGDTTPCGDRFHRKHQ